MPPPMNKNSYKDIVKSLKSAAETVANNSMAKAAKETKPFYEEGEDNITAIAVSSDGTWRRRDFKSSSGIVTAMSLVTGKVLLKRSCLKNAEPAW